MRSSTTVEGRDNRMLLVPHFGSLSSALHVDNDHVSSGPFLFDLKHPAGMLECVHKLK